MASEALKTSELPLANSLAANARVLVISGSNTSLVLLSNVFGNSQAIPVISTPVSSSSLTVPQGAVLTDGDYLYVATSNNTLKRVALSTF